MPDNKTLLTSGTKNATDRTTASPNNKLYTDIFDKTTETKQVYLLTENLDSFVVTQSVPSSPSVFDLRISDIDR